MAHPSASRIRRGRESLPGVDGRHLAREELAHRIGVSTTTLRRWETEGFPDAERLLRLADELGLPVDWLLGKGTDELPRRKSKRG